MKIAKLSIRNMKAVSDADMVLGDVLTIVGRNNTGKSTLLQALDFFFDPSKRKLDLGWFPNGEPDGPIEIKVVFQGLSDWEKEQFGPWLDQKKGRLIVAREVSWENDDFNVDTIAYVPSPEQPWLRDDEISGANIKVWWEERDALRVGKLSFADTLGTSRPNVGEWKAAAAAFRDRHSHLLTWTLERIENPKGASNVLKGTLPEFILVPAVRDITDEVKVTQTNPFGRLIHTLLDKVSLEVKEEIRAEIDRVAHRLNRIGGEERIEEVAGLEKALNALMGELMECDVELEMGLPTLQQVFGGAQIFVDDGVRTSIETKGHGMQRSMILTILRYYAEMMKSEKAGERASERSTIIAIEEPELYMHPQSQRSLMDVFRRIGSGADQILYTTHSSLFVDVSRFDEICIMRRQSGTRPIRCYPTQLMMEMLLVDLQARKNVEGTEKGMRSLYGHVFDELISEGFFADKVVIVEGPSERYAFPIYSRLLGFDLDRENVAVVHGDGKGSMDRLARIFAGLGIPVFLWFDGDKESDNAETKKKTLELLELMGESLEDISELTTQVRERYAVLEHSLEETLSEEVGKYEQWRRECGETLGPVGKPLTHRFVARKVEEQVAGGAAAEDVVPRTLQEITRKVQELNESVSLLHPDAEELRVTATTRGGGDGQS